jgi:hypothetical protein
MKHQSIISLFERCRAMPLRSFPGSMAFGSSEEKNSVAKLLAAAGDEDRAKKLMCDGSMKSTKLEVSPLKAPIHDRIRSSHEVAGTKVCFDDELMFSRQSIDPFVVEERFNLFEKRGIKASNRHLQLLVRNLLMDCRWIDALNLVARASFPSPKLVESFLTGVVDTEGAWIPALRFATRNVLTSRSGALAATIALKHNWELAMKILRRSPRLCPKDGLYFQNSLLRTEASWTACLEALQCIAAPTIGNLVSTSAALARRGEWRAATRLLAQIERLPDESLGFVVLQAQQVNKMFARDVFFRIMKLNIVHSEPMAAALSVVLGSDEEKSVAIASCSELAPFVRAFSSHMTCCGRETFQDYRIKLQSGEFCSLPEAATVLGKAAAGARLPDSKEFELCSLAAAHLNCVHFLKSFESSL